MARKSRKKSRRVRRYAIRSYVTSGDETLAFDSDPRSFKAATEAVARPLRTRRKKPAPMSQGNLFSTAEPSRKDQLRHRGLIELERVLVTMSTPPRHGARLVPNPSHREIEQTKLSAVMRRALAYLATVESASSTDLRRRLRRSSQSISRNDGAKLLEVAVRQGHCVTLAEPASQRTCNALGDTLSDLPEAFSNALMFFAFPAPDSSDDQSLRAR